MSLPILNPAESMNARAQRYANSLAQSGLSTLTMDGVRVENVGDRATGTAWCRHTKTRLIVHIVHYEGAAWEPVRSGQAPRPLTKLQKAILGACSRNVPMVPKQIAKKLGRKITHHGVDSYLKSMLRGLVNQKRLIKTPEDAYLLP